MRYALRRCKNPTGVASLLLATTHRPGMFLVLSSTGWADVLFSGRSVIFTKTELQAKGRSTGQKICFFSEHETRITEHLPTKLNNFYELFFSDLILCDSASESKMAATHSAWSPL